jgi:hypothetical protein
MHCIILFPGADGRLPTARQLRQAGFHVSAAVQAAVGEEAAPRAYADGPSGQEGSLSTLVAIAAEKSSEYGAAPK